MAEFQLREALLWEPGQGYFLLERHLRRLAASAAHFGFALDREGARQRPPTFATELPKTLRNGRLDLPTHGGSLPSTSLLNRQHLLDKRLAVHPWPQLV